MHIINENVKQKNRFAVVNAKDTQIFSSYRELKKLYFSTKLFDTLHMKSTAITMCRKLSHK